MATRRKKPSKSTARWVARLASCNELEICTIAEEFQRTDVRPVLGTKVSGNEALFPVPPPVAGLPRSYARTLRDIKERCRTDPAGACRHPHHTRSARDTYATCDLATTWASRPILQQLAAKMSASVACTIRRWLTAMGGIWPLRLDASEIGSRTKGLLCAVATGRRHAP